MLNRLYGMVMATAFLAALLSQVYIPQPDWNVYFVESAIFAGWLLVDAIDRRASILSSLLHAAAALILAPLVIPRWYAHRPLKAGEWRKGGVDANFYTAFGIITVIYTGVSAACNFQNFGANNGFELIINAGFCVAGMGLVMGMAARQDRVFEKGKATAVTKAEELE